MKDFEFAKIPKIIFGSGKIQKLPEILEKYKNILLIIGNKSFKESSYYKMLIKEIDSNLYIESIKGEPTVELIDDIALKYRDNNINVIVSIGGGSVLDAGKAISAMLTVDDKIINFIEGIGDKIHPGTKLPFIAIPTTAGTGSEMTKNAVIRKMSNNGFKKSLRHENFIPDVAIVDPELTLNCNIDITTICGLDTLTHLIESYVSVKSNDFTDMLAIEGIEYFNKGFLPSLSHQLNNLEFRESLSYASMIGGITLANSGLGIVHGFASSIAGIYDISHGIICAIMLPICTKYTINKLLEDKEDNLLYLQKYKKIGEILSGDKVNDIEIGCRKLIEVLYEYTTRLNLTSMSMFKMNKKDFEYIIKNTSNKNNPISLTEGELRKILEEVY